MRKQPLRVASTTAPAAAVSAHLPVNFGVLPLRDGTTLVLGRDSRHGTLNDDVIPGLAAQDVTVADCGRVATGKSKRSPYTTVRLDGVAIGLLRPQGDLVVALGHGDRDVFDNPDDATLWLIAGHLGGGEAT